MSRKYLNHFSTQLTAAVLASDTSLSVGAAPPALGVGDYYRLQLARYELVNGVRTLVKSEFVDWIDDNTVSRGVEGSTAQDWAVGDILQIVETAESFEKIDSAELKDYFETEYIIPAASGAVTVDRANGGIQSLAPAGDVTITWNLPQGAKQQLYATPGTHAFAWGGDYWMTDVIDTVGKLEVMVIAENKGGAIYLWDGGSRA